MKKFVAYITGFGTGIWWKKLIASIIYILMLFVLFSVASDGVTVRDKFVHLIQAIILIGIPYILITDIGNIRDRLPLFNKKKPLPFIAGLLIAAVVLSVAVTGLAQLESPQQKEVNRIAQEQREQQIVQQMIAKLAAQKKDEARNVQTAQSETDTVAESNKSANELLQKDESQGNESQPQQQKKQASGEMSVVEPTSTDKANSGSNSHLEVHFLDVGQADSIFIRTPAGKIILVDAGNSADGNTVISYIRLQGVNRIDVLIGTHLHEDHIGGMDTVINTFDIGKIYMPQATTTTKTYYQWWRQDNGSGI